MDIQESNPIILIYYNLRGQLHPIRNLLCFLEITAVEVHVEEYQQQKPNLPKLVIERLQGTKINKSELPILIHDDYIIYDIYPIMAYICYRFQAEQLLGKTVQQKAKVQELLEIYLVKQPQSMAQLFRMAEFVYANDSKDTIDIEMRVTYQRLMRNSGYLKQICQYLQKSCSNYILEEISILDFIFIQSCLYMLGGFQLLDRLPSSGFNQRQLRTRKMLFEKSEHLQYLSVMRRYMKFIMQEPFYVKNKDYLESFSIIFVHTSKQRAEGLRKFWLGDPKLIK